MARQNKRADTETFRADQLDLITEPLLPDFLALLLMRDGEPQLLPTDDLVLRPGDEVLWTAPAGFKDCLA